MVWSVVLCSLLIAASAAMAMERISTSEKWAQMLRLPQALLLVTSGSSPNSQVAEKELHLWESLCMPRIPLFSCDPTKVDACRDYLAAKAHHEVKTYKTPDGEVKYMFTGGGSLLFMQNGALATTASGVQLGKTRKVEEKIREVFGYAPQDTICGNPKAERSRLRIPDVPHETSHFRRSDDSDAKLTRTEPPSAAAQPNSAPVNPPPTEDGEGAEAMGKPTLGGPQPREEL